MVLATAWRSLHFQHSANIIWPTYITYLNRLLIQQATAVTNSLLYHEPQHGRWQRPFGYWHTHHLIARARGSVLVVQQPRWPLRQILLVVRGEAGDETAVLWAKTLAQASGATVAIMPIIPACPGMYQMGNEVQARLDILLQPNTISGQRLNSYKDQLEQADVPYHFCQQSGSPDQQIQQKVTEMEPDLIVVGAERHGRLQRWYLGEIVGPLLRWIDRPLLVAN